MPITPPTSRRRRGRPTKEDEVRQALAAAGCDPEAVDPLRILAGIAADESKPPTARVAACKALLAVRDQAPAEATGADRLNARAVVLMGRAN